MSSHIFVHTSNQLEELYLTFVKKNFPGPHPMASRWVIVPSPLMRSWLRERMARDGKIAMGMKIFYLEEAIQKLQGGYFPSRFELALKIHSSCSQQLEPKMKGRLAIELEACFRKYALYGKGLIQKWREAKGGLGEQEKLFLSLFPKGGKWSLPVERMEVAEPLPSHLVISLFGLNYFPEAYCEFFSKLSERVPISYYFLSPTPLYWGDMESDQELSRLRKSLSEKQLEEWEDYLALRHPLIASLGRLGRKMFRSIEDEGQWDDSAFLPPERGTSLGVLQSDLFELEVAKERIAQDDSLQIHQANSKLREVQIVRNQILALMKEKGVAFRDVLVMSPDMGGYAPYVRAVFDDLPWRMFELQSSSENKEVEPFLAHLELAEGRFGAREICRFFRFLPFSQEDLEQVEKWIGEFGIRWGADEVDRVRVVKRDVEGEVTLSNWGTWEKGFERLLLEMLLKQSGSVSLKSDRLIGTFIETIRSLKEDLRPLIENGSKSYADWADYLRSLYEGYFAFEPESALLRFFDKLSSQEEGVEMEWKGLAVHVKEYFHQHTMNFREGNVDAIRFCSMLPMRAIPAKVVVLMGLSEAIFPKREEKSPLNLLEEYCPTQADYDRYLFLESILSAREALIVTYAETDEVGPSSLVLSLLSYLRENYGMENLPQRHPSLPTDPAYFSPGTGFTSFDRDAYKMALVAEKVKHSPPGFDLKEQKTLTIKMLKDALKDPMKNYVTHSLGIHFPDEKKVEEEDPFDLSTLEKWKMEEEMSFKCPLEAFEKGSQRVASGMARNHLKKLMLAESEKRKAFLEQQGVRELFEVELEEAHSLEDKITLPPLVVEGRAIHGRLGLVSQQGIVINGEGILKHWAEILLFLAVREKLPFEAQPQALFLKDKKVIPLEFGDPLRWLEKLVAYALHTKGNPVPIGLKTGSALLKGKEPSEEEEYHKELRWYKDRHGDDFEPAPIVEKLRETVPEEIVP